MRRYDFECADHGIYEGSDKAASPCPECGTVGRRIFTPVALTHQATPTYKRKRKHSPR